MVTPTLTLLKITEKLKNLIRTTHFKEDLIRFNLSSFSTMNNSEDLYKGHYAMLSNKQLTIAIDSLNLKFKERKETFTINIVDKYNSKSEMDSLVVLDDLSLYKDKSTV